MAFGEKFKFDYVDLIRNNTWEIGIFEDGFGGIASSIVGSGEPVIITWLESILFEPIGSSECIVELESNSNFQFKDFLSATPNQFLIKVKKNGSLYWQGVNVTENNTEPYDDVPYSTKLKFTDGLGQLKFTEFEDGGLIDGNRDIIGIIVFCLNKLPYQLNVIEMINVLEDNLTSPPASFGFLNTTLLNQEVFRNLNLSTQSFEGWNCLAVIREILHSIGATIYQSNNKWHIVRIEEYEAASVTFVEYLAGFNTVVATGSLPVRVTIDNDAENGISWINRNSDLNVSKVFDEIEYIYKFGSPDQNPGELLSDSTFFISVNSIVDIEGFDLWELGSGYSPGLSPRKFSVTGNDFYYLTDTTGMFYSNASMQINPVFDSSKFLRSLEYAGSANTRNNLITTVNDNAVVTWDGFIEIELGAYTVAGFDQTSQLNIPYEVTFFFAVQIGINFLEEDSDGVMSWGLNASSVISVRKLFDLKKPLYSWRGGVDGSGNRPLTRVYRYGPIQVALPNFPENALSALNFKFFQPATPIIFPDLTNPGSAIQAVEIQVTPLSLLYQPNNGKILTEVIASQFSTNVKDRKKTVIVRFGDGPHTVIPNSFLVSIGIALEASNNWVKGGGTVNTFTVTSVVKVGDNAQYNGPDDHNFAVGDYIQGSGFTTGDKQYNILQRVVTVVDSKTIITNASFNGNDSGTLFRRVTHAEAFILGPYGKYFSEYRDDLRGDLTGDFDFFNSFLGDNGKIYLQRGASYRTKSNEVTVQLIELDENITITNTIEQFTGVGFEALNPIGGNTETELPNTQNESAVGSIGSAFESHNENVNVSVKSSQIIKINTVKHNPDSFRNYPA